MNAEDRDRSSELTKKAFDQAAAGVQPDLSRLRSSLPWMMARARASREMNTGERALAEMMQISRRLLPRFALAAAVLAAASLIASTGVTSDAPQANMLLSERGSQNDVIAQALTGNAR